MKALAKYDRRLPEFSIERKHMNNSIVRIHMLTIVNTLYNVV